MRPGDVVGGRFRIERLSGTGGMGKVWRATEKSTDLPVAVKTLEGGSSVRAERFAREAQILAELRHPGIVRYYAHGTTDEGKAWIAMEWLNGLDLRSYLKEAER